MKKMILRGLFAVMIAAVLTAPIAVTASAANPISIFVDGEELITDVPPQIINGRTMVPVRAVTEAVGCKVEWIDAEKRVVIYTPSGGDPLLSMYINDPVVTVSTTSGWDGSITTDYVKIDSPPVIVNGRTLVPLRFIAETIGFTVDWDENTRTVYLYSALYEPDGSSDISLIVGNWPSAVRTERIEETDDSYTDMLDGVVFLTVTKLPRAGADEDSVKNAMSRGLGISADSFPMKLEQSLTAEYSYPTYVTGFQTGANEDTRDNFALCMQTDTCDFLVLVSIARDYTDYYRTEVDSWFANLEIVG